METRPLIVGPICTELPFEVGTDLDEGRVAATIGEIAHAGECDEILLCTPAEHHSHWHRHNLPDRIQKLGIPVTVIPPDPTGWSYAHGFPDDWVRTEVGPLT